MATANKRKTTSGKRPASKSGTARKPAAKPSGRSPSSSKSPAAKKPSTRAAAPQKPGAKPIKPGQRKQTRAETGRARQESFERQKSRHQISSILLFCSTVLLLFLVIIPGQSVWSALHNVILGLFGSCAILWPLLLFYVCGLVIWDKAAGRAGGKVLQSSILICLIAAAVYIFRETAPLDTIQFGTTVSEQYGLGMAHSGAGAFSGILGVPILKLMGSVAAKIFICIAVFAGFMLLTGTTLLQLFTFLFRPVRKVGQSMGRRRDYDGDDDRETDAGYAEDGMPEHPVRVLPSSSARPEKGRRRRTEKPESQSVLEAEESENRKLTRLERFRRALLDEPEDEQGQTGSDAPPFDISNDGNVRGFGYSEAAGEEEEIPPPPEGTEEPLPPDIQSVIRKATLKKTAADVENNAATQTTLFPDEEGRDADYRYPPISLLDKPKAVSEMDATTELQTNAELLVSTLKSFGVHTRIVDISRGPAVTRYELQPLAGVKISKITNLSDDIALNLAASGVRIEAPIPGKQAVGIEVPNKVVGMVKMRELVDSNSFAVAKSKLTVALGKDIAGSVTLADLAKMPHLLIAGATGSGKSVCINSLICSLLYKSSPNDVRLLMIDPKYVELSVYNGIPHLLVPVVNDPRKAAGALNWAVNEMLNRYNIFKDNGARDLGSYNKYVEKRRAENPECTLERMPQIVIIVDELADLMMAAPKEVEDSICRLAQMARAAGMHLVIATQRPSVDVITGLIKANIPSRIAFYVSSQVDSRTILDTSGAEKLLGRGDMLFSPVGSMKPTRIQGCYLSDSEIREITDYVKDSSNSNYDVGISDEIDKQAVPEPGKKGKKEDDDEDDPVFLEAIRVVVEAGQASTSLLQRRLSLGYARAGRMIDKLEEKGIIGPHEGSKPRKVLISHQQWMEMNMSAENVINNTEGI